MRSHTTPSLRTRPVAAGFSLVELMVTLVVLGVVMITIGAIIYTSARSKTQTSNLIESSQATRVAVDMIARDLRSAGYGADRDYVALPQPPIAYIDSTQVLLSANLQGVPSAYDPTGTPRPYPLQGTPWAPPVKYRTQAEIIRWTLDLNNDGTIDASDIADPDGVDAQRTKTPNDYMLAREIYGDSLTGAAGNNGGLTERIALMRRPRDGQTPPLFTVYLVGNPNPWDWANGPIPPGRLQDIERVVIRAVGTSAKPDWRGQYAETEYQAEVHTTRNTLNFGLQEFAVDGRVYQDLNANQAPDGGEPGVLAASVRLGVLSTVTDSTGYFLFRVPAGTYTLKHQPPIGFVNTTNPDSFVLSVGPPQTRYFSNSPQPGGTIQVIAFDDQGGDAVQDPGDPGLPSVELTLDVTGETKYTDSNGQATFFAPVGAYALRVVPPQGYAVTSTNPYTNTMTSGATHIVNFALEPGGTATIEGKVFTDNNRNGVLDGGESGVENVWVGASPDGGITVFGYQYTDANGDYSITVPANDPPGTEPYYVTLIVPNGYYPTGSTSLGPLLVQDTDLVTGKNFGVASFQVITLNASRVLSLDTGDLIEQDWTGNINQWDTKGHQDADIVLGADAGGTDNIAVWFNQYSSNPLFDTNPTYTRNAPNSVLALILSELDPNVPEQRLDAVTGTQYATAGNWFVWFAQNTSGNLGYFGNTPDQAYMTSDKGHVRAVLTADVGGDTRPDVIVGTISPTAGQGTIEVWTNSGASTPTFTREDIYPPNGSIPANALGSVTSMTLVDLDGDGDRDLVVGTRTGTSTGQIVWLEAISRNPGTKFKFRDMVSLTDMAVLAVTVRDFNGDGYADIVAGGQTSLSSGRLVQLNNLDNNWTIQPVRIVDAPGIVMSLEAADMGGSALPDILMGFRSSDPGYSGGLRVYFMDLGVVPAFGTDPSAGAIGSMVPALATDNLNYGTQPTTPSPPYLLDFVAGVKTGPSTGALVVFIR